MLADYKEVANRLSNVAEPTLSFLLLAAALLIAALAITPGHTILKAIVLAYVVVP